MGTRSVNPYVFVTGCTRSGTTLLQRMLDNHPQLAVSNDTHVIPRAVLGSRPTGDVPLTGDVIEQVTSFERFGRLGIDDATTTRLAAATDTLGAFASALFGEFAHRQGKSFGGEKDPEYVRHLPFLHRLFPTVRSLCIIRDGREVALSTLDWVTPRRYLGRLALWADEPVAVCALWWKRQVLAGRRGRAEAGANRCLEVRYEELVRAPERVLRSIAAFLDLPFSSSMLEYHHGRTRDDPGLDTKGRWLPPTGGLRDWRVDLSQRDLELFEALAGDVLDDLGYPRATGPSVSASIEAVAARCRLRWTDEVPLSRKRLPPRQSAGN
jgi:Sulfotransferase family